MNMYTMKDGRKGIYYESGLGTVEGAIKRLAEVSGELGQPVISRLNGNYVYVPLGAKPEEVIAEYKKEREKERNLWQEYLKTPEGKAYQAKKDAEKALEEAEIAGVKAAVDRKTEGVAFNVANNEKWNKFLETSKNDTLSERAVSHAYVWGRLMQAEMEKQGVKKLTKKIVRDTMSSVDQITGGDLLHGNYVPKVLVMHWEHGAEFGKIMGFRDKDIRFLRGEPMKPGIFEAARKRLFSK